MLSREVNTQGIIRLGCKTNDNKKAHFCIGWDCHGIIDKEYLKSRQTINSTIYSNMLIKVSDAIREKRKKEFRSKMVLFHQDNAQQHVSVMTGWTLYTLDKGTIEALTTGSPHTYTIVIATEIEYLFVAKDGLVPFRCSSVFSCVAPLQTEASMGRCQGQHRNGHRVPKCSSARRLRMVREDTGAPNEGATCAWIVTDEAVGCTRAFLTMWRFSRRLVCRGRPEHGFRVNDIFRNHWSQHLLTTQSEQPNWRATHLADHPASIMPMILPLSNYDSCSYCLRKRCKGISISALPLKTIQHTQTRFGYLFYTQRRTTLNAFYRLYVMCNQAAFLIFCIFPRHVPS
ncbi:uncharacterized protein TNCV_3309881 [Trichonephila clavipes]|nr:uncharacterized protein TNCV_3309881 [Trichonephila clavipes]